MISEINSGRATVRLHDECCRQEIGPAMEAIRQIVSQAHRRRASGVPILPIQGPKS